jgi:hypothetical protein
MRSSVSTRAEMAHEAYRTRENRPKTHPHYLVGRSKTAF